MNLKSYEGSITVMYGDADGDGAVEALICIPEESTIDDLVQFKISFLDMKNGKCYISKHIYGCHKFRGCFFMDISGEGKAVLLSSTLSSSSLYNTFKWSDNIKDFVVDKTNLNFFDPVSSRHVAV